MGLVTFLLILMMIAIAVPMVLLAGSINEVLIVPLALSFFGGFVLLMLVTSALKGIYSAALYRFATTGDPGEHFTAEMMESAFRRT
jgi:hypothetical protein